MPGLFQALEVGKRALLSNQYVLQTIGHNIANVDTPGFTRQRVTMSTSLPNDTTSGPVGTGVKVDDVRHVRDLFLGQQYREAQKSLGQWNYKEKTLTQIESLFNEPQNESINDLLNGFWDAWSDLSTNADSVNNRQLILASANQLIAGVHQLAQNLNNLQDSVNRDLGTYTSQINSMTAEIARLNQSIASSELGGQKANDLRDSRDLLIDELSSLIDVRTVEKDNGANIVFMGTMVLVDATHAFEIETMTSNEDGKQVSSLVWKGTSVELKNLNGQLRGLVESRDATIPDYLNQLDEFARTLVEQVNTLHSAGYGQDGSTGVNFFDPNYTSALTIRINAEVENNINKIVASTGEDSDNITALAISDLRNMSVMSHNTMTINDFYGSLVGKLGVETREAASFTSNYELLVTQVENSRQSVQGVSLDEEMTNLIKYQHAYDAAARVITTMDEALDTVIYRLGIVGT